MRDRQSVLYSNINHQQQSVRTNQKQVNMKKMKQSMLTTDSLRVQSTNRSTTPQKKKTNNNNNNNIKSSKQQHRQNSKTTKKQQLYQQFNQLQQQTAMMNEIMQMLRMIYIAIWDQTKYEKVLKKYQQMEDNQFNEQFSVEGKLLEDIVNGIEEMKMLCSNCNVQKLKYQKNNNIGNNNNDNNNNKNSKSKDINTLLLNDYYLTHYQNQHNFVKKKNTINNVKNVDNNNNIIKNTTDIDSNQIIQLKQQYKQQLQKKQKHIKKLQSKIKKLQLQLQQYKQQSVNLHRLNESKYSQISQLRRQIEQQQSCIEQQVSVIEELEKTLNESVLMGMGNSVCGVEGNTNNIDDRYNRNQKQPEYQNRDNEQNNNVLGGLEEEIMMENHKRQEYLNKIQEYLNRGKQLAYTQLLQQIEQEILRIQLQRQQIGQSNRNNNNYTSSNTRTVKNTKDNINDNNIKSSNIHIPRQLQQQQFELTSINMNNLPNHRYRHYYNDNDDQINDDSINNNDDQIHDNNGIEQIQLSFYDYDIDIDNDKNIYKNDDKNDREQSQLQQQQQISHIYHQHQHQHQRSQIISPFEQQPSLVLNYNILKDNNNNHNNDNNNNHNNDNNNNTNYLQSEIQEYSIISNNPSRYLQTIQTMTQQLTQAYQTINQLQTQLSQNNIQDLHDNQKQKNLLNRQSYHYSQIVPKQYKLKQKPQKHLVGYNNNNQHYNNLSPNNPQSKNISANKTNKQSKKNKSTFGFNLSFWK